MCSFRFHILVCLFMLACVPVCARGVIHQLEGRTVTPPTCLGAWFQIVSHITHDTCRAKIIVVQDLEVGLRDCGEERAEAVGRFVAAPPPPESLCRPCKIWGPISLAPTHAKSFGQSQRHRWIDLPQFLKQFGVECSFHYINPI